MSVVGSDENNRGLTESLVWHIEVQEGKRCSLYRARDGTNGVLNSGGSTSII